MSSPEILFHGHRFLPDPSGALYWAAEDMLIVSDLHFEKSTYLATHGSFIAPYDTHDTIDRLEALLRRYKPQRLALLGDSFHDAQAWHRLDVALRQRIEELTAMVEHCHWIEGNHDRSLSGHPFTAEEGHQRAGILLTHEPAEAALPQLIGHYHPKVSIKLHGRRLRDRCFVQTRQFLIMPAFGSYTGGLDVRHDAFATLAAGSPMQLYLIQPGGVYMLPIPSTDE